MIISPQNHSWEPKQYALLLQLEALWILNYQGEVVNLARLRHGRWRKLGSNARNEEKTAWVCCDDLLSKRR